MLFEYRGKSSLEPDVPEQWMPGRRLDDQGCDVPAVDEFRVKLPVKQKQEVVFRMCSCNPSEVLMHEPPDPFQPVFQQ